jgi:hypothetical protein
MYPANPRTTLRVALLALVGLTAACGRDAGPSEDDRGKITYWLVNSGSDGQEQCTDHSDFRDLFPTMPPLNAGVAYYYIYRVSTDGRSAVDMSCQSDSMNQCTPNSDVIWKIDGHVLTTRITQVIGNQASCKVTWVDDIRLEDKGGEAEALDHVTFVLEGEDCDDLDASVKEQSPNGFGLRDCVAERKSHAIFSHSRDP